MFLNQIFCTQIKSSPVIQSWFKSNHYLDLLITAAKGTRLSLPEHMVYVSKVDCNPTSLGIEISYLCGANSTAVTVFLAERRKLQSAAFVIIG